MTAKEMFEKINFYKLETSHYIGGITYIKTLGKEYEEVSFFEDDGQILIPIKNINILDGELIRAINKQVKECKELGCLDE